MRSLKLVLASALVLGPVVGLQSGCNSGSDVQLAKVPPAPAGAPAPPPAKKIKPPPGASPEVLPKTSAGGGTAIGGK